MSWKRWRTNCLPWNWSTRTWCFAIVASMLASPFVMRRLSLWQVPDVALNFDEEDFFKRIEPDVSDEQNAFVNYATAAKLLTRTGSRWSASGGDAAQIPQLIDAAVADLSSDWDERLTRWLSDNAETLAEFRLGGDNDSARDFSLRTCDSTTILTVHNEVRQLAQLALLEAIRCERSGDLEEAWLWHRANLRCAHHAETPPLSICRAVSCVVRIRAMQGLAHWSESATLTTERLREARREFAMEVADRTPLSTIIQSEYLMARNTLQSPDAPNHVIPLSLGLGTRNPALLTLQRAGLWVFGMPEVPLRVMRQVLVNQHDQIDLPRHVRGGAFHINGELVFERPPGEKHTWGRLRTEQFPRILGNAALTWRRNPNSPLVSNSVWCDEAIRIDNARVSAVAVVLAAQEFHRRHDEFPVALEELVPDYLDAVPFDPMDATGAPLRYRRDADGHAIVWSIGRDETDDSGHFGDPKVIDKDAGFRIRRPHTSRIVSDKAEPLEQKTNSTTPQNTQQKAQDE